MNLPRFYVNQPLLPGTSLTLDSGASNHLCGVLRLKAGVKTTLFNGSGGEVRAELVEADRRRANVLLLEHIPTEREAGRPLILCQGIAKGEKMDWIVQKATELGAHSIVLFYSEYSPPLKTPEWRDKKVEQWSKVILSACEQCGRNRIPVLHPPKRLAEWVSLSIERAKNEENNATPPWPQNTQHLWLSPDADQSLGSVLKKALPTAKEQADTPIAIWIGPEGGFSPADTVLAQTLGAQPVKAGARVLRTETAGLAALAVLQAFVGDW